MFLKPVSQLERVPNVSAVGDRLEVLKSVLQRLPALLLGAALTVCGCQAPLPKDPMPGPAFSSLGDADPQHSAESQSTESGEAGQVREYRGQSPGGPGSSSFSPSASSPLNDGEVAEPVGPAKWLRSLRRMIKPPDKDRSENSYAEADKLFKEGDYSAARKKYRDAADRWPNSTLEEDALFMMAECDFFADDYPEAFGAYGEMLNRYSNTRHIDVVTQRLFAIATYWQQLQQTSPRMSLNPNFFDQSRPMLDTAGNARKCYQAIWMKDPTGPLADYSVIQVGNSYFMDGRYEDADSYYTQLRRDHPNSKYLIQAYLLGIQAKLQKYQGPGYDNEPLDEAEQLIKTLLTQFRDQLGDERERVLRAQQIVRAQQAERHWERGEFYARGNHHQAARMAYQRVVDDYPETKFAELAQEEIPKLADKPAKPKRRLTWLDNIFPQKEDVPIKIVESPRPPAEESTLR